jgi:homoaconitase
MASRFASRPLKSATSVARLGRRNLATPAAAPLQERDCRSITPPYEKLLSTLQDVRKVLPRGTKLTLAEKILYSHVRSAEDLAGAKDLSDIRGQRYLKLAPDRVAMQVSIPFVIISRKI